MRDLPRLTYYQVGTIPIVIVRAENADTQAWRPHDGSFLRDDKFAADVDDDGDEVRQLSQTEFNDLCKSANVPIPHPTLFTNANVRNHLVTDFNNANDTDDVPPTRPKQPSPPMLKMG